ncbi:unnamed protein product [Moneuplotes crassus]|uniref:Uncharacterized protein n=1 Tax=Euplotes crassus TaxID=5936 RepID=A0AAD1X9M2_EUPCR|nr:unnamed protein product [Moneuplotes crassus]
MRIRHKNGTFPRIKIEQSTILLYIHMNPKFYFISLKRLLIRSPNVRFCRPHSPLQNHQFGCILVILNEVLAPFWLSKPAQKPRCVHLKSISVSI